MVVSAEEGGHETRLVMGGARYSHGRRVVFVFRVVIGGR